MFRNSSKSIKFIAIHFRNFSELTDARRINQFPYENVITVKDLLSVISRRIEHKEKTQTKDVFENTPTWLPITFNLKTEIPKFVSYFQQREER